MRILYLTEAFPYPLTTGYLRQYFFLRELAKRHSITLLSLVDAGFQQTHRDALVPFTERILTFAEPIRGARTLVGKAIRKFGTLLFSETSTQAMCQAIGRLIQTKRFDVVVCSDVRTFPAVAYIGHLPLVADLCEANSCRLRATACRGGLRRRFSLWLDVIQTRHVERRLLDLADRVLFASARDRRALLGADTTRAFVVPNGVDADFWRRTSNRLGHNTIVFTGQMAYQPNWDAALYLIQDILPEVRKAVPEVTVLIVGRDPPETLRSVGQQPGVTVTGFVDDVRPYLEQATVFAAPLRFASGIQNKLLEALAMELPVVASPLAAEGLRTEEGLAPPIEVASGREAFVAMLIEQLKRRGRMPVPVAEGRDFVQQHFSWTSSGERLEAILQEVASPDVQPAAPPCS